MSTSYPSPLQTLLAAIEEQLAAVYGFALLARAEDHLMVSSLRSGDGERSSSGPLAQVIVDQDSEADSCFIGIAIDESLVSTLTEHCPLERLDHRNLDAFMILVEEISHFHLVVNRATRGQSTKLVELELQGEIDKVIVSAEFLASQHGDAHFALLLHLLESGSVWTNSEEHYLVASRLAHAFLSKLGLAEARSLPTAIKAVLHESYYLDFNGKNTLFKKVA